MGRRKIEIRAIKDDRNRSVTFLKRKGGLFKKAHELSVLCSVEVAVIIFGNNKKLYEYSSGDINQTLQRYQYYGQPHEHKGPGDFKNKGGDDDDDEDEEDDGPPPREDSLPPQQPPMMPAHLQNRNTFQHVRQPTASASPPIQHGMFPPRHATPQPPQMGSRPSSRLEVRRPSSNLVPMQPHPTPPPQNNGFAYVPNPSIYQPQPNPAQHQPQPQPSPQPQFQQYPPVSQPQQSQQTQLQIQQAHQQYFEQRRSSQPSAPQRDSLQPPSQPVRQPSPQPSPQPRPQSLRPPDATPPQVKQPSSKSQSIFTPIDEGGSVLARHFFGAPDPPPRSDMSHSLKRDTSPDIKPPPRSATAPRSMPQPPRPATAEFPPPSRVNTDGSRSGSRPKLNLTIPSEDSENEGNSGSSRQSGGASANPTRGNADHIVLPPPSPSASAVMSAGATGPPNPFARPPPPTSNQNTNAYSENRNNIETPISALPSRYMSTELLPSPSNFFSEWGDFGRNSGLGSAVLPSPLTFPTPADARGPGFQNSNRENTVVEGKRKENGGEERDRGEMKRVKT